MQLAPESVFIWDYQTSIDCAAGTDTFSATCTCSTQVTCPFMWGKYGTSLCIGVYAYFINHAFFYKLLFINEIDNNSFLRMAFIKGSQTLNSKIASDHRIQHILLLIYHYFLVMIVHRFTGSFQ